MDVEIEAPASQHTEASQTPPSVFFNLHLLDAD